MPTKRPRHTITGNDEIERALRRQRPRFPRGTSDSAILATLIVKGDEAAAHEERAEAQHESRRLIAAERLAARFHRPDGFDAAALAEASERWTARERALRGSPARRRQLGVPARRRPRGA
jgi:hypothetical protein